MRIEETVASEIEYKNGFRFLYKGNFYKTKKEAESELKKVFLLKKKIIASTDLVICRIYQDHKHLFRMKKEDLKSFIVREIPHYKGTLYMCSKRDLIGIIKEEKLITL